MMTRLARERNRSALAWSLFGIAAWIGGEFFVAFALTFIYELGAVIFGWPIPTPAGLRLLIYLLALMGAIASVTIVARVLRSKSMERSFPIPPPPPEFLDTHTVR